MTRRPATAIRPVSGVARRVEEALARSAGSLRLWLVFEDVGDVAEAKALLSAAKARHVEALTSAERERREGRAFRLVAERAGIAAAAPAPVDPVPVPETSPIPSIPSAARRTRSDRRLSQKA